VPSSRVGAAAAAQTPRSAPVSRQPASLRCPACAQLARRLHALGIHRDRQEREGGEEADHRDPEPQERRDRRLNGEEAQHRHASSATPMATAMPRRAFSRADSQPRRDPAPRRQTKSEQNPRQRRQPDAVGRGVVGRRVDVDRQARRRQHGREDRVARQADAGRGTAVRGMSGDLVPGRFGPGAIGRAFPPELQRLPVDQGEDPPRAEGVGAARRAGSPRGQRRALAGERGEKPLVPGAVVDPDADPVLADVEAERVAPSIG
jgi:hypothetical protein